MLSKTQSKYIRSLTISKFRKEYQNFIAEGERIVAEWLLSGEKIEIIVGIAEWIKDNKHHLSQHPEANIITVTNEELKQISTLKTPNKALAVIKQKAKPNIEMINDWCLALDAIRDPGNMGTILRIADWFGIPHVVCSPDCVDTLSPKVVQAAMGAHLRITIHETDLNHWLPKTQLPKIAAVLEGENIYHFKKIEKGILVIGNEGKGISNNILDLCNFKVTIPRGGGAESLNAGVSAGILCALLLKK